VTAPRPDIISAALVFPEIIYGVLPPCAAPLAAEAPMAALHRDGVMFVCLCHVPETAAKTEYLIQYG
jgi:hypothetical protein